MLPFIPPQMPQSTVRPYHSTGSSPKKKESKTSTLRDKNENGRTPLAPDVQTPPYVDIAGTLSEAAILPVVDESPGTPLASTAEKPPDVDTAGTLSEAAKLPVVDESPGTHSAPNDEPVKHIVDPNEIHAGTPRSGGVVERFATHRYYDENGKSDFGLQLLWQAKHTKFVKHGYTSLIGEVATYIDRYFTKFSSVYELRTGIVSTKKFTKWGDIRTGDGSYEAIIRSMHDSKECTLAIAKALLESLSLPQMNGTVEPTELDVNHGIELFSKLVDEKKSPKLNAQKLMGVLICEAIRFQDDGALARMAIRGVISLFPKGSDPNLQIEPIIGNPFYKVFVAGENPVVFAKAGGKQATLNLFFKPPTGQGFSPLSAYVDETSDVDEDGSSQETAINPPKPTTSRSGRVLIPKVPGTTPRDTRTLKHIPPTSRFGQRNLMDEFFAEENKDGKTTGQDE